MDWSCVDYLWIILMFYQLFGLSFWRHPFTAVDPLVGKWCNTKFIRTCSNEEINSSTSWMTWAWVFWWTCFIKVPYYGLWKFNILVLGVPNNRLTCKVKKHLYCLIICIYFLPYLLNNSQTIHSTIDFFQNPPLPDANLQWLVSFSFNLACNAW